MMINQQSKATRLPLITVVTVVYNGVDEIEATVQSVLAQRRCEIQYVVIDGGSNDGTEGVLEKYKDKIDVLISEKDDGLYDAMNKAVRYSLGEWVCFMNCGDRFYDEQVVASAPFDSGAEVIFANHLVVNRGNEKLSKAVRDVLQNIWKGIPFSHQACFVKLDLYRNLPFSVDDPAADYAFFLSAAKRGAKFQYHDSIYAKVSVGGYSDKFRHLSVRSRYNTVKDELNLIKIIYYKLLIYRSYVRHYLLKMFDLIT